MIHARSVRLATVIVLGGAAALATTACGGPMQAGAAVVVQGQRTSDRDVQSEVASYITMSEANKLVQPGGTTDQERANTAKAQIGLRVQQALWQKAADDLGLTVGPDADAKLTATLVEETRSALGPTFHGSDNEAVALAFAKSQQYHDTLLSPATVPMFVRQQVLVEAVVSAEAAKLKVSPNLQDPTTGQVLGAGVMRVLTQADKEIDVKIAPRYGAFDLQQLAVVATTDSWIRPGKAQIDNALQQMQQQPQ
ncbi:MAG: hypothetical protein HOW97_25985 [Catenulispora sp.]|nr:hypothetical protein [Catenulispora sp.]